jgi:bifunctional DNase/RNase
MTFDVYSPPDLSLTGVEMIIDSLRQSSVTNEWVVILKEKGAERYLPIYVACSQIEVIRKALLDEEDCDLPLKSVGSFAPDVELQFVMVSRFGENGFKARLILSDNTKDYEVNIPLTEALAIGFNAGVPLIAEEALLEAAGISTGSHGRT